MTKPYTIELASIGNETDGVIHVVLKVNNKTYVFKVETPRIKKIEIKNGNLYKSKSDGRGRTTHFCTSTSGENCIIGESKTMM